MTQLSDLIRQLNQKEQEETKKRSDTMWGCLLFSLLLPSWFYTGWALWKLWGWFLSFLIPTPAYLQCVGVMIVVFFLRGVNKTSDGKFDLKKAFGTIIFGPIFSVALGWLFHKLVMS